MRIHVGELVLAAAVAVFGGFTVLFGVDAVFAVVGGGPTGIDAHETMVKVGYWMSVIALVVVAPVFGLVTWLLRRLAIESTAAVFAARVAAMCLASWAAGIAGGRMWMAWTARRCAEAGSPLDICLPPAPPLRVTLALLVPVALLVWWLTGFLQRRGHGGDSPSRDRTPEGAGVSRL